MKNRKIYSFSVLRYVHDVATSEFINVGIAFHCPENSFFEVSCRTTSGRIGDAFPDIDANAFRSLMRGISKRFREISEMYKEKLDLEPTTPSLEELLRSVLPKDDSALVWTPPSSGLTLDPEKKLTDLYSRYVSKYDSKATAPKRSDADVWRTFHKGLEDRRIADYFTEKTIEVKDDEVKFKTAWKNGIWHCIEPISFDLSAPETIKEKAHRFLGQMTSVRESAEKFKVYLVLGKPEKRELDSAFINALEILKKLPVAKEIYLESETDTLLDSLKSQINAHQIPMISSTQAELTISVEEQVAEIKRKVVEVVDQASKNAPPRSEVAVAFVRSAIGSANAGYEQFAKSAKQAVEALETDVNKAVDQLSQTTAKKGTAKGTAPSTKK